MRVDRNKRFHLLLLGVTLVFSWLLLPLLIRPLQVPAVGDYLLLAMLFCVGLIIWPLTTVALLVTRGADLIKGNGLFDLAGVFLVPVLITIQGVRVMRSAKPRVVDMVILHLAIIGWFWLAWRGLFTNGFSLMGTG